MRRGVDDFEGEVVLVTGASSGIGLATVRQLTARGASVVGMDYDPRLLATVRKSDQETRWHQADVSDQDEHQGGCDAVRARYSRIDAAVLNAGIDGHMGLIGEFGIDEFDRVMTSSTGGLRGSAIHPEPPGRR